MIKVKELLGRGRGLVATRTIGRGSTVLFEAPLILVEAKQGVGAEVRRQYQALTIEQRQHYDSLSPEITSKQGRVEKIFWKHCVQHVREGHRAIYSRYMHERKTRIIYSPQVFPGQPLLRWQCSCQLLQCRTPSVGCCKEGGEGGGDYRQLS